MSCSWHARLFSNRGLTLYHLARYEEALRNFNRSLAINPDDPDTLNYRGACLIAMTDAQYEAVTKGSD